MNKIFIFVFRRSQRKEEGKTESDTYTYSPTRELKRDNKGLENWNFNGKKQYLFLARNANR